MGDAISIIQIFKEKTLTAGASDYFEINLERENANGYFSLHIEVTDLTGTLKCELNLSNSGVNFVEPTGSTDIFSTFGVTSGPGANGIDIYSFEPELAKFIRIVMTEDGSAQSVKFDAWLAIQ